MYKKVEPFEKYAEKYEEWFERNRLVYLSELEALRRHLPKAGSGLEIGVGSARFAAPLGIKFGVEPSKSMAKIAKQRGVSVVIGVAEDLPFVCNYFDFALMVTTICFLNDIEAALKEIKRVLKPKGLLIIGFIDKNSPIGELYQRHKEDSLFYKVATFYSVKEVIVYLKRLHFSDFRFTQTIFNNLKDIKDIEQVVDGYGGGSFVVIVAKNK